MHLSVDHKTEIGCEQHKFCACIKWSKKDSSHSKIFLRFHFYGYNELISGKRNKKFSNEEVISIPCIRYEFFFVNGQLHFMATIQKFEVHFRQIEHILNLYWRKYSFTTITWNSINANTSADKQSVFINNFLLISYERSIQVCSSEAFVYKTETPSVYREV